MRFRIIQKSACFGTGQKVGKYRVSGVTRKSIQEINFTSNNDRRSKSAPHKKRMRTIRCACGFEILVLPDLKAMNRAIKNHVAEHKQARDGSDRLDSLTEFLTEQTLIVTSNINPA
jgi:hypothetical protein